MARIDEYTPFQQNFALAWAQANLTDFLRTHPEADVEEKEKEFLQAFENGLYFSRVAFDE